MSRELLLIVKAIDKASGTLQSVSHEVSGLGKEVEETSDDLRPLGTGLASAGAAGIALMTTTGLLTARVDVLGTVLDTVGGNAGYSAGQLDAYEQSLAASGITTRNARQGLIQLAQAEIDLTNSTDLARMAQDAAVIANVNSSEAYTRLITVVQRGSPLMARSLGLSVDFQSAYEDMADSLGITTGELTKSQKQQARLNEVLDAGTGIAGTYEAAMGDVGKQLTSLPRYFEEAGVALGRAYQPAMEEGVTVTKELLQAFVDLEPEQQKAIAGFIGVGSIVATAGGGLILLAPKIVAIGSALGTLGGSASNVVFGLKLIAAGSNTAGLGMAGFAASTLAVAGPLAALLAIVVGGNKILEDHHEKTIALSDSYERYEDMMRKTGRAALILSAEEYEAAGATDVLAGMSDKAQRQLDLLAGRMDVVTEATEGSTEAVTDYSNELGLLKSYIEGPMGAATEDYLAQRAEIDASTDAGKASLVELEQQHRETTNKIMYDILMARLSIDGWTEAELNLATQTAYAMGLIDEETYEATVAVNAAVDTWVDDEDTHRIINNVLGIGEDMAGLGPIADTTGDNIAKGLQLSRSGFRDVESWAAEAKRKINKIPRNIHIHTKYSSSGTPPGERTGRYQMGTEYVPQTGLAFLHEGEAVLTRSEAATRRAGGRGGGAGGVIIHQHFGAGSVRSDEDILAIAKALEDSLARHGVRPSY